MWQRYSHHTEYLCQVRGILTLTVLVMIIDALGHLNRIIAAQSEGMGDVGSASYEPAVLPPYLTIRVLSYSNCQRSTRSISK